MSWYKLGRAIDPEARVKSYNPIYPFPTVLLHTIAVRDMICAEAYLHKRFAEHRTNGEWFNLPKAAVDWLLTIPEIR